LHDDRRAAANLDASGCGIADANADRAMEPDRGDGHLCHHTVLVTFIRKPLLLLLVLVCAASLAASGRFSLRLFFDTAIALGAVPLIQVIAFSVVYWTGRRPLRFATAMDDYFAGSWAWFFALAAIGVFGSVGNAVLAARWFSRVALACGIAAALVSVRIDWRFFQQGLGRGSRRALVDVLLQRTIGWSATVLYFLMTAIPKAGSFIPDVVSSVWGRP
jgi:hypothetical protein